jgi:hypothetical protein
MLHISLVRLAPAIFFSVVWLDSYAQPLFRPSAAQILSSVATHRSAIFHQRYLARTKRYEKALVLLHNAPNRPLVPFCIYQDSDTTEPCLNIDISPGDDYSSSTSEGAIGAETSSTDVLSYPGTGHPATAQVVSETTQTSTNHNDHHVETPATSLSNFGSTARLPSDSVPEPLSESRRGSLSQEDRNPGFNFPGSPKRHALIIANAEYDGKIPKLGTPATDAKRVAKILEDRFGYSVTKVFDATKRVTIASLNNLLTNAKGAEFVLIYYAGHGYSDEKTEVGYWIPVDASADSPDRWISNADVNRVIRAMNAKNVLLVSDSCFSGRFVAEAVIEDQRPINQTGTGRAITVLSSGDDEPVSDDGFEGNSVFAWSFSRHLEKANEPIIGHSLWNLVRKEVSKVYPQTPRYGALLSAGHTLGLDFVFFRVTK